MLTWLPELQKIIERFEDETPHADFRLWLSSNPTPHFPLAILQRGLKMTTEPPKGLRANLSRLYQTCVTQESFDECVSQKKYGKLLFALTYFHAVMLERRKFRTLGINIPYDFNDTDYSVSDDVLKAYLDAYEETPWDALKYLISEANYGGRVTDEIDRRVLAGYLNQFFCEDALNTPRYPLSSLEEYYIPTESGLDVYRDYIGTLPQQDKPEAFGQHPNADISYMITDSTITLESCLALQPKSGGSGAGGAKIEDVVSGIIDDMLSQTPQPFNHEKLMKDKADDPSPLHVTLFQEVERYNILLNNMLSTLNTLKKGIKGLVVMSADLDSIFESLANNKVPAIYLKAYPSLRPLGSWTRDLLMRLEQIDGWIENGYPRVYWLAGFTYPSCFLTAVLQTTARKNAIPIDTLSFEYSVMDAPEEKIGPNPKEGVYIKDMYLEGAGWNFDDQCLCEPNPMELIVNMPIVHFKPSDAKKKRNPAELYQCPLYMYPVRTGSRERPSFMVFVDLKAGDGDSDFWVKRGTALLLALAT
jgi:dynein heavy chain